MDSVKEFFEVGNFNRWPEALDAAQSDSLFIVPGETKNITTKYVSRGDISDVIASSEGENDGIPWLAIFKLKCGNFMFINAWCDYTGFDCRGGGHAAISSNLYNLLELGVTKEERVRLFSDLELISILAMFQENKNI